MCGRVKNKIARGSLLSVLLFFPFQSQALEWQMSLQHAGFMGEVSFAGGFENESGWMGMDLGVGISRDQNGHSVQQLNMKLRFGFPVGVAWRVKHWSLYAESVLLDTDALAQYNSDSSLNYREIMSSAVGLRYYF